MKLKKYYYFFLHLLFILSLFYAFGQFITTPRVDMLERRLWAYENWIIISFYGLFVFLTLTERELRLAKIRKTHVHLKEFKRVLTVNLILLIFPWGLFLLLAPADLLSLLSLNSIYWRILGGMSLLGALIYYFPYRFYKNRLTHLILVFGALDNLLAALILTGLFAFRKVNLIAWSSAPLLFYFAYFFRDQAVKYREIIKRNQLNQNHGG